MTHRDLEEFELGRRVSLSLTIDNDLSREARLAALEFRCCCPASKDQTP